MHAMRVAENDSLEPSANRQARLDRSWQPEEPSATRMGSATSPSPSAMACGASPNLHLATTLGNKR